MTHKQIRDVAATYLWENGMVMTFSHTGEQIPELQGRHTPELVEAIRARSDERTKWNGFGARACVWTAPDGLMGFKDAPEAD